MKIHIPAELKEHEGDIRYVFDSMIRKLHVSRSKGWVTGSLEDYNMLLQGLQGEMEETKQAAFDGEAQFACMMEAVDTANMALLLAVCLMCMEKATYRGLSGK